MLLNWFYCSWDTNYYNENIRNDGQIKKIHRDKRDVKNLGLMDNFNVFSLILDWNNTLNLYCCKSNSNNRARNTSALHYCKTLLYRCNDKN